MLHPSGGILAKKRPELAILSRDERWAIIGKPPRLLVHRNAEHPNAYAAVQWLRDQLKQHVYPVHRLDHAASGCLLFSLDPDYTRVLQAALTGDSAEKRYLAFVRGEHRLESPLTIDRPMADERGVLKEATSIVERLGASAEPRCSLLLVRPRTGRFHQVRRHVRDLGHPILGDTKHGDSKVNRWWRETYGMERLGLHCLSLDAVTDTGERIAATCPLFDDQAALLAQMPWWTEACERLPELELPALVDSRKVPVEAS